MEGAQPTVWNIELPNGKLLSCILGPERPTRANGRLKDGQKLVSGPYPDIKTAMVTARLPLYRAQLVRLAMEQGILPADSGHHCPSLMELAEWAAVPLSTLRGWMTPVTSVTSRSMSAAHFRHLILELKLRDQSTYRWEQLLEKERAMTRAAGRRKRKASPKTTRCASN